jgi:hypothetical protein
VPLSNTMSGALDRQVVKGTSFRAHFTYVTNGYPQAETLPISSRDNLGFRTYRVCTTPLP